MRLSVRIAAVLLAFFMTLNPAMAEELRLSPCPSQTEQRTASVTAIQFAGPCPGVRNGAKHWLWLYAALPRAKPHTGQIILFRQSRFRRLHVVVQSGGHNIVNVMLPSGVSAPNWIIGGFAAFKVPPETDGGSRVVYFGLEDSPTATSLRARVFDLDAFERISAAWTVAIGLFLGVLVTSLTFNALILLALRTPATMLQLAWTASVLCWGIFWSQVSLLLFPALAGTANARLASCFAAAASALPMWVLIASIERGKLPRWLRRAAPLPSLVLPPTVLFVIFDQGPALFLRSIYDAAVVINGLGIVACCVIAWRRGSTAARTIVWTFTLPTLFTVAFAFGSLRGSSSWGLSEINIMATTAVQSALLTASLTVYFLTVRRDRDLARVRERQASAVADAATTANRAKSDFLLRLSHEMRAPLNAVSGHAQLLAHDPSDDARRAGSIIQQGTEHIGGLVKDLLDMSLLEAGRINVVDQPLDLVDLLRQLVNLLSPDAEKANVRLRLALPPQVPDAVIGDRRRLRQILINLLTNAIKYGGGEFVEISLAYSDQVATISISDQGPGIPSEDLQRLFVPFQRGGNVGGATPGLGLGLTIAQGLASAMQGRIDAATTPGKGSVFSLRVPLPPADNRDTLHVGETISPTLSGAGRRILIVEDDPQNRELLVDILEPCGFVLDLAEDIHGALALGHHRPDLAIVDLTLPGGSGWDVARELRRRYGDDTAILICSADAAELERPRRHDDPHDDVLVKPYAIDGMLDSIGTLIEVSSPRRQRITEMPA